MYDYLPAYPLLASDPYLSVWSSSDHPAQKHTTHWAGDVKRLLVTLTVDGKAYALVGQQDVELAQLTARKVTPTQTQYTFACGGVEAVLSFRSPLLLSDLDVLSTPANYVTMCLNTADGQKHQVGYTLTWYDDICHDLQDAVPMMGRAYETSQGKYIGWMGRKRQEMLCHSSDHITIDWGYAYMLADAPVAYADEGERKVLRYAREYQVADAVTDTLLLAYDDVASIQYFEYTARAWYARNGKSLPCALHELLRDREKIFAACDQMDAQLTEKALKAGGENYAKLCAASYRQTICAHKLIADRDGNAVFLSKENDSNGCIGTVDVSYPSVPLYLMYAPELVKGMCRPVLRFAKLPVWKYDFAPHDVGRYPYATGQVYGLCDTTHTMSEEVYPPLYLYDGPDNLYKHDKQMPVEECGNMILMLAAALKADGDESLIRENLSTLEMWVKYLEKYGADPGEQLCTDDFAGHLARNVNLAFKAVTGLAAYGWIMEKLGDDAQAAYYRNASKEMAKQVVEKAKTDVGTALTLDGNGWSLKYNTVWDQLFGFDLFSKDFYRGEIERYLKETNVYGVPLDSRREYTKSDWIMWAAALGEDAETVEAFAAPIVRYLKETPTRVPFSDWYETVKGNFCYFIARSVQGGIFMPMLKQEWRK